MNMYVLRIAHLFRTGCLDPNLSASNKSLKDMRENNTRCRSKHSEC